MFWVEIDKFLWILWTCSSHLKGPPNPCLFVNKKVATVRHTNQIIYVSKSEKSTVFEKMNIQSKPRVLSRNNFYQSSLNFFLVLWRQTKISVKAETQGFQTHRLSYTYDSWKKVPAVFRKKTFTCLPFRTTTFNCVIWPTCVKASLSTLSFQWKCSTKQASFLFFFLLAQVTWWDGMDSF